MGLPLRLLALALVACSESGERFEDVMKTWLPDAGKQAWQGSWVLMIAGEERGDQGTPVAVSITGDRALIFDGTTETEAKFTIERPCEATFTTPGKPVRHVQFVWTNGALELGVGDVGLRRGKTAVVCGTGRDPGAPEEGVFTVEGNHCETWRPVASGWTHRTGVCIQVQERGDDIVMVGTGHYSEDLIATGEVLRSRQFQRNLRPGANVKLSSYAQAKVELRKRLP